MAIRFRQFVKNHRKAIGSGLVLFICAVVLVPQAAEAQWYKDVLDGFIMGVAWLVFFIAWLGGQLLVTLITILVWVASYNNFINEPIVSVGWTIIRDLCNMAFIIALLYMAFNMVFGIKKGGNLLTLIINAGLINFSKVISGFVIDISQVVMLTFVNGFYKIAGGNILEGLGFTKMFEMVKLGGTGGIDPNAIPGGDGPAGAGTVLISIVFALILIYIAVGMVLTFIIMLIGRIFKLWGLLITSPVPFVKKILPGMPDVGGGGGNYWGELAKTAAAGPILAFWLWLIFTSVSLYNRVYVNTGFTGSFGDSPAGSPESLIQGGGGGVGWSQAGTLTNIMSYIIFIGLMMLALQQAQSQANAMHSIVGNAAKKLRGGAYKLTMKGAKWSGRQVSEHGGRPLGYVASKFGFDRTAKILNAGVAGNYRAVKDLVKDKGHIFGIPLSKEKREQKRKLREQGAKEGWYEAHADYVQKKPGTKYSFRTNELLSQSSGEVKKLEDQNLLQSQGQAQFQFDEAIRTGQESRAIGIATHMAEKGWGAPDILMRKIQERFGTSEDAKKLILQRMESRASKAEGSNEFASSALSSVREDLDTGDISIVDTKTRIGDAREKIQRATNFNDVDTAFARDRKTFNFKNIEDNRDEIEVRVGVISEWAKKMQENAAQLDDPVQARRWLERWGSKERRTQVANQLRTLVALAKDKHVDIKPQDKEALENMTRLMSLDNEQFSTDVLIGTGPNKKINTVYNFKKVLTSAKSGNLDLRIKRFNRSTKKKISDNTSTVTDQIFDQVAGPRVDASATIEATNLTKETIIQRDKFLTGVRVQEEKMMRTADDKPTENDTEIDRILRTQQQIDASKKQTLLKQLNSLQDLQERLSHEGAKSSSDLDDIRDQIRTARNEIRSTLAGIKTNLVDENTGELIDAGDASDPSNAFDKSNLKNRLDLLENMVDKMYNDSQKIDPATGLAPGSYTPEAGDRRNMNALAGGAITAVDRTLHDSRERQFKGDRKRVKGNKFIERGLVQSASARRTSVREDRVGYLIRARRMALVGLKQLEKKHRNDPTFIAEATALRGYLGGLDFEGNPDHLTDKTIDEMTKNISKLLNKYIK